MVALLDVVGTVRFGSRRARNGFKFGTGRWMAEMQVGPKREARGGQSVGDGADDAVVSADVRKALHAERLEALNRTVAELKATRSELQYDLSVSLDTLAEEKHRAAVAEEKHSAAIAEERHLAAVAEEKHSAVVAEERHLAAVAEEKHSAAIAEERHLAAVAEEKHLAAVAEEKHLASVAEEKHSAAVAEERRLAAVAEEKHSAAVAEERRLAAVAEEKHSAAVAEGRHLVAVAAERQRVALAERDIESFRELAALRQQLACVERDNEALRDQVRRYPQSLVERRGAQLADLRERLSLVVHDRKSLRRELKRRGQLLARVRSDLRAAEKSVSALQRSVRGLEREKWVFQGEAVANGALRKQNVELAQLVDQLCDGFHAVLASRRWRLGGALMAVPRLLLLRRRAPTAPDAMLRLVAEHRRRRTMFIGRSPAVNQGPSGGEDGGRHG